MGLLAPLRSAVRWCSTSAPVRGTVVSFSGRHPLIRLTTGTTVTLKDSNAPFMMAKQDVVMVPRGDDWEVVEVLKGSVSKGESGALWNNKFAKQRGK